MSYLVCIGWLWFTLARADAKLVHDDCRAAQAHILYFVFKNFVESMAGIESNSMISPPTKRVLRSVVSVFGLTQLLKNGADLLETGYLSPKQMNMLRNRQKLLLASIRGNAVGLVDAFGLLDYELNSALGRSDGDVYHSLLEMAQRSELNRTEEGPAWKSVLEPKMKARSRM